MLGAWHLAQLNIARLLYPLDDPRMRDFVEGLDAVNALAERSEGFVWRLQTDSGNATDAAHPWSATPAMIVNMSVWESPEALKAYVYRSNHIDFFRRRSEWFEKMQPAQAVLWWIPAGHIPTLDEAKQRLDGYLANGPTAEAFWFTDLFRSTE